MRFLLPAAPERIRFGWLPVIAGIVGTERVGIAKLGEQLGRQADRFEGWLTESGLTGAPTGNVRQSAVGKLARMGVTYGIYNEATEKLTDLGHVLRLVSGWTPKSKQSPLTWTVPKKWIGLRVLFEGAGDAILSILRHFPEHGFVDAPTIVKLVEGALGDLLAKTTREEKDELTKQVERCVGERARQSVVDPYLEPLRDLGYAVHSKGAVSGYRLTESGRTLKALFDATNADAEALIKDGLSQIFLKAEGRLNLHPANAQILRRMLLGLPPELTVSESEAPLEPIALLAQATLLEEEPGAWINPTLAHELLKKVGAQIEGRVFLRPGQSIVDFPNVAWMGEVFADESIWDVATTEHANSSASINSANEIEEIDSTTPFVPIESDSSEAYENEAEPKAIEESITTTLDEIASPTHQEHIDPYFLLDPTTSGSLRVWLQYVAVLLEPPELGAVDLALWGGFETSLRRLRANLDLPPNRLAEKRSRRKGFNREASPHPLVPLERAYEAVKKMPDMALIVRVKDQWVLSSEDKQSMPPSPEAAIERAISFVPKLAHALRDQIVQFITHPGAEPKWASWEQVRGATRCLIQDALSSGGWFSGELIAHMLREFASGKSAKKEQIGSLLAALGRKPIEYTYIEKSAIPIDSFLAELLTLTAKDQTGNEQCHVGELETPGSDGTSGSNFEFTVVVKARSVFEACTIGRTCINSFLAAHSRPFTPAFPGGDAILPTGRYRAEEVRVHETQREVAVAWPNESLPIGASLKVFRARLTSEDRSRAPHLLSAVNREPAGTDGASRKIARAWHGLVLARDPQRSPAERLALTWSGIEQLVKGGEEGKANAVFPVAAAATILHLRKEMARIYWNAIAGLWATVLLDHANTSVDKHVQIWPENMNGPRSELKVIPRQIIMARWAAAKLPTIDVCSDEDALTKLWNHWSELPSLRDTIEPLAPLASNGLHDFMLWLAKDPKNPAADIGSGSGLSGHARTCREDFEAFLLFVYELRNRFVHDGEVFEGSEHIGILQILERLLAIVEPVIAAVSYHVNKGRLVDQVWRLAHDINHDLCELGQGKENKPLTLPRLAELLCSL